MDIEQQIVNEYRHLQKIRREGFDWLRLLGRRAKHWRHYDQSVKIQGLALRNHSAVYNLMFDNDLSEEEKTEILDYSRGHSSLKKSKNRHMVDLYEKLRKRIIELPEGVQRYLVWLKRVHKY